MWVGNVARQITNDVYFIDTLKEQMPGEMHRLLDS